MEYLTMNEQTSYIGPIMKAARKFKKFNQSDVAHAIGCSQSALSKMEHNLLVPNAPQWFIFSRYTTIPPETIESGLIDRGSKIKLNNDEISLGFKLPKRYRLNRAQKVKELYPFLTYLEKKVDQAAWREFIKMSGIDPEFYLDFDNVVNLQLLIDLVGLYHRLEKDKEDDIKDLVSFGQNENYWNHFLAKWRSLPGPKEVLSSFAADQIYFQGDFHIQVEYVSGQLMLSYIPEAHLYQFLKDLNPQIADYFHLYRKYTLENLIQKTHGVKCEIRKSLEKTNSLLESRFEIHF